MSETGLDLGFYARRNLTLTHGDGALLYDDSGREYIDCVAGMGVAALGHAHPVVADAIAMQAKKMITCPNLFWHEPGALLMDRLAGISHESLNKVFFCNSGAEAMEAGIKLARLTTGRSRFIAAEGAFHGRTLGALSATHREKYRTPFEPLVPGFTHVPFNDFEAMAAAADDDTAGILLEVVQGEGGIHPADGDYLKAVRRLCDERGILMIFDEVQTGLARTGRWFAHDHFDVVPDVLALAKALAGGLPMGAVLTNDKVTARPGLHGTTFGGNPLCAAAGVATLTVMEEEQLPARAQRLGMRFAEAFRVRQPAVVKELRHLGLMMGIELHQPAGPAILKLQDAGVLVFGAGENVIRLLPPLIITEAQLDEVLETVLRVLRFS